MSCSEEDDIDVPLAKLLKRKKNKTRRKSPKPAKQPPLPAAEQGPSHEAPPGIEVSKPVKQPPLPDAEQQGPSHEAPPGIEVSEFDYSVENHFKAVDTIAKLCGHPEFPESDVDEIQHFSSSITFLREWRYLKYAPLVVKFSCQHNSKDLDVIGEITLPPFSSAAFPKREMHIKSDAAGTVSSKDFLMNVGGAVWALDWCPKDDRISENHIMSEFVAVAAHPPESSYHKIGAPLTGRGAVEIWCLLSVPAKEQIRNSKKVSKLAVPLRPRGRPRKKPRPDPMEDMDTVPLRPRGRPRKKPRPDPMEDMDTVPLRPRGRPRKEPRPDPMEDMVTDTLFAEPISIDDSECSTRMHAPDLTSSTFIPKDVALPRLMLCLAHNGKVAWDVKWRPLNSKDSGSINKMGHLAVLLGNGALEVWEVPLPCTVKRVYPAFQERIDPRFIKLRPIFRCSMLKCGDRQSIPLTMEWSVSPPNDMIMAGCHDGTVAIWKFAVTSSSTETRPLLCFNADTGPIRTLAWGPTHGDLGMSHVVVTAGHKGFKFWDIRDPFRPLWEHYIQGVCYSVEWLTDPRCVLGSTDDGTLWLVSLVKVSDEIPVAGKSPSVKHVNLHSFFCSSFAIWSLQASPVTGMIAYCGEDGKTFCFQPTKRLVKDPRKANKVQHHLCGSVLEKDTSIVVASPLIDSPFSKCIPSMTRGAYTKAQEKTVKENMANGPNDNEQSPMACDEDDPTDESGSDFANEQSPSTSRSCKKKSKNEDFQKSKGDEVHKGEVEPEFEVFPPKMVAMHRVRWNVNKGSERWLCYGGAAGLVRCQEIDLSGL